MKSFNLIDKSLLGTVFILLIALFTIPEANAQVIDPDTCSEYCESLCGTPTLAPCQYTFCPGSSGPQGTMCFGVLQ